MTVTTGPRVKNVTAQIEWELDLPYPTLDTMIALCVAAGVPLTEEVGLPIARRAQTAENHDEVVMHICYWVSKQSEHLRATIGLPSRFAGLT